MDVRLRFHLRGQATQITASTNHLSYFALPHFVSDLITSEMIILEIVISTTVVVIKDSLVFELNFGRYVQKIRVFDFLTFLRVKE